MKRYNILPDEPKYTEFGQHAESRIKIEQAVNGEWVRYEDVQEMLNELNQALVNDQCSR